MVCDRCEQDLSTGASCTDDLMPDGVTQAVRFGQERGYTEATDRGLRPPATCHDCGVTVGGLHHRFCDVEECPRCHDQLLYCACWVDQVPADDAQETEALERWFAEGGA